MLVNIRLILQQKEKELEIGYDDKFGVVGRRLPIDG